MNVVDTNLTAMVGVFESSDGQPYRSFYEFFSGGGLVRVGLGTGWDCVGAIDNDARKIQSYINNFGDLGLIHADIRDLSPDQIPTVLDMAWASFPCKDVSAAGSRDGLDGVASGAWWPCWSVLQRLVDKGRAPGVIVLENVRGLISSNEGKDFTAILGALVSAGYRVGAVVMDARVFVPQSRVRIFIVGILGGCPLPPPCVSEVPSDHYHPMDLRLAVDQLPAAIRRNWIWWGLPKASPSTMTLADVLDPETDTMRWHSMKETADLVDTMGPNDLAKLEEAKKCGCHRVGTIYVRSRPDVTGRRRRANVRLDGCASCLVTPNGKYSAQIILDVTGKSVRTRGMTIAEASKLMGLPSTYQMPRGYNAAFQLCGDGVAVPVVRHLAQHLLEPLVDAVISWRPRMLGAMLAPLETPKIIRKRVSVTPTPGLIKDRPGIKGATLGTTVYLVPAESKRVRRLALELDTSLHELLLRGLDRLLAENGQRPVERYQTADKIPASNVRSPKGKKP